MKTFVLSIKNNEGQEDYEDITIAEDIDEASTYFIKRMPIEGDNWDKETLKHYIREYK